MKTWLPLVCVLLLQLVTSGRASDPQRTIPQFRRGQPAKITLEYKSEVKGWDAKIMVDASGNATKINGAIMRLFDADGKEVPPVEGRVMGIWEFKIEKLPFKTLINLAQCYDLSKTGIYRFEWGSRLMGTKQVESQIFEFEIVE